MGNFRVDPNTSPEAIWTAGTDHLRQESKEIGKKTTADDITQAIADQAINSNTETTKASNSKWVRTGVSNPLKKKSDISLSNRIDFTKFQVEEKELGPFQQIADIFERAVEWLRALFNGSAKTPVRDEKEIVEQPKEIQQPYDPSEEEIRANEETRNRITEELRSLQGEIDDRATKLEEKDKKLQECERQEAVLDEKLQQPIALSPKREEELEETKGILEDEMKDSERESKKKLKKNQAPLNTEQQTLISRQYDLNEKLQQIFAKEKESILPSLSSLFGPSLEDQKKEIHAELSRIEDALERVNLKINNDKALRQVALNDKKEANREKLEKKKEELMLQEKAELEKRVATEKMIIQLRKDEIRGERFEISEEHAELVRQHVAKTMELKKLN